MSSLDIWKKRFERGRTENLSARYKYLYRGTSALLFAYDMSRLLELLGALLPGTANSQH